MITPGKFISPEASILARLPTVLMAMEPGKPYSPAHLYSVCQASFSNIDEFVYALDALYILNKIDFDSSKGLITYA